MNISASATRTGQQVDMLIGYGDEDFLHPELIRVVRASLRAKNDLTIRDIGPLTADYANSDGFFKFGTILSQEENPTKLVVSVEPTNGHTLTYTCPVVEEANTITSKMA